MRFAYDFTSPLVILAGILCLLAVVGYAFLLIGAALARARARGRFGEPALVEGLSSFDSTGRRAAKGVLLVVALASAFAAFARPQFGKGTKLVPATNLDVVIVLDYSKSMYARDIVPSRIARAKAEVARLISGLPGARFGAVAFAGEPMSFPLTSDGAAIAQFFRQLEPNDMPIGGTATARALERGHELFAHDPKSKDHVRVMVLITDGEDLEGEPDSVAKDLAQEGTRVDVVQIGGRAPEPIPEVGEGNKVTGLRKDETGKILTTELSADGEAQLARIAQATGGTIVRSEHGETGIDTIAKGLTRLMREELSEKVETIYAEEFAWPLGVAVVLLMLEALLAEAPHRKRARGLLALIGVLAMCIVGCQWNPSRPFEREAPEVKQAVSALDAGDAMASAKTLQEYLSTGPCAEGNIGVPDRLKLRPDGTFDLGLALFAIGESYGRRFGEEELDGGVTDAMRQLRRQSVECALRVLRAIGSDESVSVELRARARYLEGNLLFLVTDYEEAVKAYDLALRLAPGEVDAGDPVGRDAAWNRAIAQRRIEDKKNDAGPDASPDGAPPDASSDAASDSSPDSSPDSGNDGGRDGGSDAAQNPPPDGGDGGGGNDSGPPDAGDDSGPDAAPPPPPSPKDAGLPPPQPKSNPDERILDQLENAPTVQQEAAKKQAKMHRMRGMVDK